MKKLLLTVIIVSLGPIIISCTSEETSCTNKETELPEAKVESDLGKFKVIIIDHCEYIEYDKDTVYSIAHKGNCKNHKNSNYRK